MAFGDVRRTNAAPARWCRAREDHPRLDLAAGVSSLLVMQLRATPSPRARTLGRATGVRRRVSPQVCCGARVSKTTQLGDGAASQLCSHGSSRSSRKCDYHNNQGANLRGDVERGYHVVGLRMFDAQEIPSFEVRTFHSHHQCVQDTCIDFAFDFRTTTRTCDDVIDPSGRRTRRARNERSPLRADRPTPWRCLRRRARARSRSALARGSRFAIALARRVVPR